MDEHPTRYRNMLIDASEVWIIRIINANVTLLGFALASHSLSLSVCLLRSAKHASLMWDF